MGLRFDNSPTPIDMFESNSQVLVNAVNCVGVMGKGLALDFKRRYPAIEKPYREVCLSGALKPGDLFLTPVDPATGQISEAGSLKIIHIATKNHWRDPSKIEWIERGLQALATWIVENEPASISIPRLGTGNGHLDWKEVRGLIQKHLSDLPAKTDILILGAQPASEAKRDPNPADKTDIIASFRDQNDIYSNMYRAQVLWGDEVTPARIWPCNELPYVLGKTLIKSERDILIHAYETAEANKPGSGGGAVKRTGSDRAGIITLRSDWNDFRLSHMTKLVRDKFTRNPELGKRLLATGNTHIQEGNTWGDTFWGISLIDKPEKRIRSGDGQNHLGKIIMATREAIRSGELTLGAATPAVARNSDVKGNAMLKGPRDVVHLDRVRKSRSDPLPDDVVDLSRYGRIAFRDGTKLGNRFVMDAVGGKDGTREDVIRKYADEFSVNLKKPGFADWVAQVTDGKRLGCFCAPKACHCDVIKAAAEAVIAGKDPQIAIKPFLSLGLQVNSQIARHDRPMAVAGIGSRETPDQVLVVQSLACGMLAADGWILRSGGADGGDIHSEKGLDNVAGAQKRIFLPWKGFEARIEKAKTGYVPVRASGQEVIGVTPEAMNMAAQYHPKWTQLSDAERKLHSRNCYQVLERDLKTPADGILCYTEGGLLKGGTAQALRIANDQGIPVTNLGIDKWMRRIRTEDPHIVARAVANEVIQRAVARRAEIAQQGVAGQVNAPAKTSEAPAIVSQTEVKTAPKTAVATPMKNAMLMR